MQYALACLLFFYGNSDFKTKIYQPPPEDSDYFLELPVSAAFDSQGRLLALDIGAHQVFIWDKTGAYHGHFGREGDGPGEFQFPAHNRRRQGLIAADEQGVYVFESVTGILHIFSPDYQFIRKIKYSPIRGRALQWGVLAGGSSAIHIQEYHQGEPFSSIFTLRGSTDPSISHTLRKREKGSQFRIGALRPDGRTHYHLRAFSAEPYLYASPNRPHALIAHGDDPVIRWVDAEGRVVERTTLEIPRSPVTAKDKAEYRSRYFFKMPDVYATVSYADLKPFFEFIYPIGDSGYLTGRRSPAYGHIEANIIDRNGKMKGSVRLSCGENGSLLGANHRIILIHDQEDEFEVKELVF